MPRLVAFYSDVGTVRKNNEDVVWAGDNTFGETMVIACDGLGGHAGGEIASSVTLQAFQRAFKTRSFKGSSQEDFRIWFNATITSARLAITNAINGDELMKTMATTVTGGIIAGAFVYVFNCGDSRTYLVNPRGVKLVTVDHNVFNLLKEQGADQQTWDNYRGRLHALTACVGAMSEEPPLADVGLFPADDAEYLIAATDGFSSFVDDKHLFAVRDCPDNLEGFVKDMIALAISSDSNDNVSLAVAKIHAGI